MNQRIFIQEVVTRDGFQVDPTYVPTDQKINLINEISQTGVDTIEVTSFVSQKAVPNLKDAEEVMLNIERNPNVVYVALVPNVRGAQRALTCKVDKINLVMSASETHNRANVKASNLESLNNFKQIMLMSSGSKVKVNGTVATAFGCPFEGVVEANRVMQIIEDYLEMGMDSVTLADTTGMATPRKVKQLLIDVRRKWPEININLHFHNTRGMGLANVLAGIEAGEISFDAALGGIGGCPFAPGATGNICTEDLVHMLHAMDYETGIDLNRLLDIARKLPVIMGHDVPGYIIKAGKITDLHTLIS